MNFRVLKYLHRTFIRVHCWYVNLVPNLQQLASLLFRENKFIYSVLSTNVTISCLHHGLISFSCFQIRNELLPYRPWWDNHRVHFSSLLCVIYSPRDGLWILHERVSWFHIRGSWDIRAFWTWSRISCISWIPWQILQSWFGWSGRILHDLCDVRGGVSILLRVS